MKFDDIAAIVMEMELNHWNKAMNSHSMLIYNSGNIDRDGNQWNTYVDV